MNKNLKISLLFFSLSFLLNSCAITQSSFIPSSPLSSPRHVEKNADQIDFFTDAPQRAAFKLGMISVEGNEFSDRQDLIAEAKKKAAQLGGDLILPEDSGVSTTTLYFPGYTTYQTTQLDTKKRGIQSKTYAVGPEIKTYHFPWENFSVWVYAPSQIGLKWNDHQITGFHLNSDAPKVGVKVGDILLGIDQYDIQDDRLASHLLRLFPGDPLVVTIFRDGERIEFSITAVPN